MGAARLFCLVGVQVSDNKKILRARGVRAGSHFLQSGAKLLLIIRSPRFGSNPSLLLCARLKGVIIIPTPSHISAVLLWP